jgi:hypothetical protein
MQLRNGLITISGMFADARRAKLIRLLVRVDQQLATADRIARDENLSVVDRRTAEYWRTYYLRGIRRIEAILRTDASQ